MLNAAMPRLPDAFKKSLTFPLFFQIFFLLVFTNLHPMFHNVMSCKFIV